MKKQIKQSPSLSNEIKVKIIDRWRYYPLNSIPKLAEEFKCSETQIHKCINDYLATKIPS
jgi:hypothetical protein